MEKVVAILYCPSPWRSEASAAVLLRDPSINRFRACSHEDRQLGSIYNSQLFSLFSTVSPKKKLKGDPFLRRRVLFFYLFDGLRDVIYTYKSPGRLSSVMGNSNATHVVCAQEFIGSKVHYIKSVGISLNRSRLCQNFRRIFDCRS
jgi:hypothetical protein